MENYKVRTVIESIDSLIEISIPDEDRKQEFKTSIGHYKSLMLILRKKVKITQMKNSRSSKSTHFSFSRLGLFFTDATELKIIFI